MIIKTKEKKKTQISFLFNSTCNRVFMALWINANRHRKCTFKKKASIMCNLRSFDLNWFLTEIGRMTERKKKRNSNLLNNTYTHRTNKKTKIASVADRSLPPGLAHSSLQLISSPQGACFYSGKHASWVGETADGQNQTDVMCTHRLCSG